MFKVVSGADFLKTVYCFKMVQAEIRDMINDGILEKNFKLSSDGLALLVRRTLEFVETGIEQTADSKNFAYISDQTWKTTLPFIIGYCIGYQQKQKEMASFHN